MHALLGHFEPTAFLESAEGITSAHVKIKANTFLKWSLNADGLNFWSKFKECGALAHSKPEQ